MIFSFAVPVVSAIFSLAVSVVPVILFLAVPVVSAILSFAAPVAVSYTHLDVYKRQVYGTGTYKTIAAFLGTWLTYFATFISLHITSLACQADLPCLLYTSHAILGT